MNIKTFSSKLKAFINTARLNSLPLVMSGIIIAGGLAYYYDQFSLPIFILSLITASLLQIITNLANDYGDREHGVDSDEHLVAARAYRLNLITRKEMQIGIGVVTVLAFIIGVILLIVSFGTQNIIPILGFTALGILCIAAALFYTTGNHPYGHYALGDFSSFFFFGVVGVFAGLYLYTHTLHWSSLIPGIAVGLPVAGVMHTNNMRDVASDKAVDKRTVANIIGEPYMRYYALTLLIGSMILFVLYPVIQGITNPLAYLFVIAFIPYIKVCKRTLEIKDPSEFTSLLLPLAVNTFVLSILFALCMAIFG